MSSDRRSKLNKSMDELFPQQDSESCRVCNEPVVDGRWNYCSERCRAIAKQVQRHFLWDTVRKRILRRDDRTCQHCGLIGEKARRAHWQTKERIDELTEPLREDADRWRRARRELRDRYGLPLYARFQVDHVQRVADGGHPLDAGNLQTLCRSCHATKTAAENAEEAEPAPDVEVDAFLDGGVEQ